MKKILNAFVAITMSCGAYAADLVGTASVRMTSDTATTAKTMAINDARRQILVDKLSQYSMRDQLSAAVRNAKSADLANLISETSIDGEQISDTTYSANITMTVDKNAARRWLAANGVQNWLSDGSVVDAIIDIEEKMNKEYDAVDGGSLKDSPVFAKMKEIVEKGNVTRILIRKGEKTIVNFPLTAGVIGAVLVPWGAILGIIAALGTQCDIEFVGVDGEVIDINGKVIGVYRQM